MKPRVAWLVPVAMNGVPFARDCWQRIAWPAHHDDVRVLFERVPDATRIQVLRYGRIAESWHRADGYVRTEGRH